MNFTLDEPQTIIDEHLQECPDALLFVGMGVGKTAACLHRLNDLFLGCESMGALIIAPMRVANLTWPMEIAKWDQFSWMKVANLRTEAGQRAFLNGTAHIYLINYDAIKTLVSLVECRGKRGLPYDVVLFDELTKAKNPGSKRINLYRRKVPRAARHWGLTGTPMPNSWMDLFAQVRLVDDGARLGNNFRQFKVEHFYGSENTFAQWKEKQGTAEALEQKISDITVTLKSSEWLDIPDTVVVDVDIPFCISLRKQYEKLEKELVIQLRQDKTLNVANAAALVTKLLQFTSGHMYDEEKEVHSIHNLKFDALRKVAKDEKSPLLVAYMFKHEEQRIRAQFPHARFFNDCKHSSPERTIEAEKRLMADWNAGKVRMLASHPASVGHGLNLQEGGNALVWITQTYSREMYEQMIFRLSRRGQDKITKVYRLMVAGTVDDAVAEAVATKAENEARLISALQMLESYRNAG